ncbi:hypothetical protein AB0F72_36120 [Actinoplanes sp. NPDC023936]|uniref:hypothetical protein n=1 Tax=Actinoplanes sp. NPDC023936 TaxID=3154910 RepID=UPI0033F775CE
MQLWRPGDTAQESVNGFAVVRIDRFAHGIPPSLGDSIGTIIVKALPQPSRGAAAGRGPTAFTEQSGAAGDLLDGPITGLEQSARHAQPGGDQPGVRAGAEF